MPRKPNPFSYYAIRKVIAKRELEKEIEQARLKGERTLKWKPAKGVY